MTSLRNRPQLLLIDDTLEQRDLYQMALEREFNILTAARGADGVSLASTARPDLIVLDVMMPGMDGWETCAALKSHETTADIPVILLTAATDSDLSQHAVAVGATALLRKPCPADRLRATILTTLSNRPTAS